MREETAVAPRFVTSRLGVKSQTVVPKEVRAVLGVGPGDQIGYSIQNGRVTLSALKGAVVQGDPFAGFDEWASEADTQGYGSH
jgi:bifunctional DNA-binding transcriptional regulator/antitoxin component of YhaV-PrlF toxin-antitoxin module